MAATSAPSPTGHDEHMLGHGFYNKHSHAQGAANAYGLSLIARASAGFFRAAYEPVLFVGLRPGRSPESRQAVKDLFARRLEAALTNDPSRYSAHWVLQPMLVSKQPPA